MGNSNSAIKWFEEPINEVKGHNFFYKLLCLFMLKPFKKLTYKELYLIFYGVNRGKLGEENAKKKALKDILKIFKENNGFIPDEKNMEL